MLRSGWYPPGTDDAAKRLAYYASKFPLVEVDSTYYALPSEKNSVAWIERTPAHFTFDIKAFSLFTQHPTRVESLPKNLRDAAPEAKRSVYAKDLPAAVLEEIWAMFARALLPLHSAGKLGMVFFQFPEWFVPSNDSKDYIVSVAERLRDYRIAVEFRRRTWMDPPERAERTLQFLADHRIPYVCVDMPQGFDSSVPPLLAPTTDDLAVVRFHGHNDENWKRKGISTAERFDYLYSDSELGEWAPRIAALAEAGREVHALFNNCYGDKAVRNASRMAGLLSGAEE